MSIYKEIGVSGFEFYFTQNPIGIYISLFLMIIVVPVILVLLITRLVKRRTTSNSYLSENQTDKDEIANSKAHSVEKVTKNIFTVTTAIGILCLIGIATYTNKTYNQADNYYHDVYAKYGNYLPLQRDIKQMKINYIHDYVEQEVKDESENVEFKEYTLFVENHKETLDNIDTRVINIKHDKGLVYINATSNKTELENEIFKYDIPVEFTCENKDNIILSAYLVKENVMKGFPKGLYNAKLKVPNQHEICE